MYYLLDGRDFRSTLLRHVATAWPLAEVGVNTIPGSQLIVLRLMREGMQDCEFIIDERSHNLLRFDDDAACEAVVKEILHGWKNHKNYEQIDYLSP